MVKYLIAVLAMAFVLTGCSEATAGEKFTYHNKSDCVGGVKSKYICAYATKATTLGSLSRSYGINFSKFKRINKLPTSVKFNTTAPLYKQYAIMLRSSKVSKASSNSKYKNVTSYAELMKTDYRKTH